MTELQSQEKNNAMSEMMDVPVGEYTALVEQSLLLAYFEDKKRITAEEIIMARKELGLDDG